MLISSIKINTKRQIDFENLTLIKSGNGKGKTFLFEVLYLVTGASYDRKYLRKSNHYVNKIEVKYSNGEEFLIDNGSFYYRAKNGWSTGSQDSIKYNINKNYIGANNIFKDETLTYRSYVFLNFLPETGYGILNNPFPFVNILENRNRKKIRVPELMDLLLKKYEINEIEQNSNAKKIKAAKLQGRNKIKKLKKEFRNIDTPLGELEERYYNNTVIIDNLKNTKYEEKNIVALKKLSNSTILPDEIKLGLKNILERHEYQVQLNKNTEMLINQLEIKNQEIESNIQVDVFKKKIEQQYINDEIAITEKKMSLLADVKEIKTSKEIKKIIEEKVKKYVKKYEDSSEIRMLFDWMEFDEKNYELTFYDDKTEEIVDPGSLALRTMFNTALLLAFHEYMIENDIPHVKLLVFDTYSQPFEQSKEEANFTKFINMIKAFSKVHPDTQIILIEKSSMCDKINTDDIKVIDMKEGLII